MAFLKAKRYKNPSAAYNTALAMFIFEYSETLAGGPATLSVQTPAGTQNRRGPLGGRQPLKAGYF